MIRVYCGLGLQCEIFVESGIQPISSSEVPPVHALSFVGAIFQPAQNSSSFFHTRAGAVFGLWFANLRPCLTCNRCLELTFFSFLQKWCRSSSHYVVTTDPMKTMSCLVNVCCPCQGTEKVCDQCKSNSAAAESVVLRCHSCRWLSR